MYCKCGALIPEKRESMGFNTCVECSKEKPFVGFDVSNGKTGNETQVIKDLDLAKELYRLEANSGVGGRGVTEEGMNPGSRIDPSDPIPVKIKEVKRPDPTKWEDERIGAEVLALFDEGKAEEAREHLERNFLEMLISPKSRKALIAMMRLK